jgi:ribonuclease D
VAQHPVLTNAHDVAELCRHIRDAGSFALDTEFVTENTYTPELSLVQIATPDRIAVIDSIAVPELDELWDLVADPSLPVIMHGAEQEERFCWDATGRMPGALFDVQLAVAFTGLRYPMNYSALVGSVLGIQMHQNQTRTDWTRRPLSPAQLEYAAEDVEHLHAVRDRITQQLDELGRVDWLQEERDRKLDSLAHDIENPRWWRVSGAQGLSRRSLAALRAVYFWRESLAERRDMPRKRVLRDDLIVSVATALPENEDSLRRLRGYEKRKDRDIQEILNCVHDALEMADDELPASRRPHREQSLARMLGLLMEAVLDETCADQEIDTSLVGTASDLRELIRWHLGGRSESERPTLMQGWRALVCGDILEAVLAGDVTVSVADPTSDHPLRIQRREID